MGKSSPITVGYYYRMGIHGILGRAPIDRIVRLFCDNKELLATPVTGGTVFIDKGSFFQGGEVPDGLRGRIWFHLNGTPTFSSYLQAQYGIPSAEVPRFDQVAHVVFGRNADDENGGHLGFYIGNQPRPREFTFYAERTSTDCPYGEHALLPYTHPLTGWGTCNDFNPLVMHWHLLQDGHEEHYGTTWAAAAATVKAEGIGISAYTGGGDREAIEQEICRYIDARPYTDRQTGLREIQLIRQDFDVADLPVIGEADILGDPDLLIPDRSMAVNTLDITFSDRAKKWDSGVVTVQDSAHVAAFGVRRQAVDYRWVTSRELAVTLGFRDVRAQTAAGLSGSVRLSGLRPDLHEGSPFVLDLPEWGISTEVCRIVSITERGPTDCSVDVAFVLDVFGVEVAPTVVDDTPEELPTEALPALAQVALEAPYWFGATREGATFTDALAANPDFGALMTAAQAPDGIHMGYDVWVDPGTGYAEEAVAGPFGPAGELEASVARMGTSLTVSPMDGLEVGHLVLLGGVEIVRVDAITTGASWTLTVGRGCLDTAPVAHTAGAALIGLGDVQGVERDYTDGQELDVKLLTFMSGDTMDLSEATAMTVTMGARAIRPYPPGRFKVNGSYLDGQTISADPVLTWVERNRLLQVDETHAEDHDEAGIAAEAGTTYVLRAEAFDASSMSLGYVPGFSGLDVGSVLTYTPALYAAPPPSGTSTIRVSLAAKRDGYESWTTPAITVAPVVPFTPGWQNFPGTAWLERMGDLTGMPTSPSGLFVAQTFKRTSTAATYKGLIRSSYSTASRVAWLYLNDIHQLVAQSADSSGSYIWSMTSAALAVNTPYLALLGIDPGGVGARLVVINLDTGAVTASLSDTSTGTLAGMASGGWLIGTDDHAGINNFTGHMDRSMVWTSYADPTSGTVQGHFHASGALKDPAVAVTALGTPILSITGTALQTGTNAGTGGNLVKDGAGSITAV